MQTDGRITNLIPEAFIHFWIYIREIYLMKYMNYVTVIYITVEIKIIFRFLEIKYR